MSDTKKSQREEPDRWFLEIRSQISGPFNGMKILERMLKDEVLVLHRVSRDRTNWTAICNQPFFDELITRQLRVYSGESVQVGQMKPGDDDEEFETSEIFGLHGATEGISEQLEHARQLEELTANIQKLNALRKEMIHNRKTVFVEKEALLDEVHPDDQNVFVPIAPKKASWKEIFTTTNPVHKRRMYMLLAVIAIGVGGTQGYYLISEYKDSSADKAKLQAAIEAQATGDYAKAMAAFKGIKDSSLQSADFASAKNLLDIADAHITGKDTKTGSLLLKQAMSMRLSPVESARAHALQSLIATQSGDMQTAEIELETSLKKAEIYSTLHNLAILKMKAKKNDEAEPLLLKALQVAGKTPGMDTGSTVLALFETAYDLDRKMLEDFAKNPPEGVTEPPKMRRLEAVADLLELHMKQTVLKQQMLLAMAVVRETLGQREAFQLVAYEFIDKKPSQAESKATRELDEDLSAWARLVRFCTEIYKVPKSGHFGAAFYGACLWRSHGAGQALPFAKYALALRPGDALFAGLASAVMIELGQKEEAKKVLYFDGKRLTGSKLIASSFEALGIAPEPLPTDPAVEALPTSAVVPAPAPGAQTQGAATPASNAPVSNAPASTAPEAKP